jgi:hypothetical protein
MLLSLLALATCLAGARDDPRVVDLHPIDEVWVYPHAGDPSKDEFLRVWGSGGKSIAGPQDDLQSFSYSYLRFDVSKIGLEGGKLVGATLILTHVENAGFEEAYVKERPLEVRPVSADWDERTWSYSDVEKTLPSPGNTYFGRTSPTAWTPDKEFAIKIDLLPGPGEFARHLREAKGHLGLALTAAVNPEEAGMAGIYKFFSKDGPEAKRPVLRLKVLRSPTPTNRVDLFAFSQPGTAEHRR